MQRVRFTCNTLVPPGKSPILVVQNYASVVFAGAKFVSFHFEFMDSKGAPVRPPCDFMVAHSDADVIQGRIFQSLTNNNNPPTRYQTVNCHNHPTGSVVISSGPLNPASPISDCSFAFAWTSSDGLPASTAAFELADKDRTFVSGAINAATNTNP